MLNSHIEIDLNKLEKNAKKIRNHVDKSTKIMAVIKQDCYGHGVKKCAKIIKEFAADEFAVSSFDEALLLRENFKNTPILILGHSFEDKFQDIILNDICQSVSSFEYASSLDKKAEEMGKLAKIHINIDSGMSRFGFRNADKSSYEIERVFALENIEVLGIYTHFASSDASDDIYLRKQALIFEKALDNLKKSNIKLPTIHACNSAALMRYPEYSYDMVRAGMIFYGFLPPNVDGYKTLGLEEIMTLKTKICRIEKIEKGFCIGYDEYYKLEKDAKIATCILGYSSGLSYTTKEDYYVSVRGKKAAIRGPISMHNFMIDITDINDAEYSDDVLVFGTDENEFISIEKLANAMGVISCQLSCSFSYDRIPRIYKYIKFN